MEDDAETQAKIARMAQLMDDSVRLTPGGDEKLLGTLAVFCFVLFDFVLFCCAAVLSRVDLCVLALSSFVSRPLSRSYRSVFAGGGARCWSPSTGGDALRRTA